MYLIHTEASKALQENPHWRTGQAYFNVVHRDHPGLANVLRSGPRDPFHNDRNIEAFVEYVEAALKNT